MDSISEKNIGESLETCLSRRIKSLELSMKVCF